MRYGSFYTNFTGFKKANDALMTKDILLHEVADAIANHRDEVIDKLNYSHIPTDSGISAKELTDKVMANMNNKKFAYRMSLVLAKKNKDEFENFMSADAQNTKRTPNQKNGKTDRNRKINVIGDVATELGKITEADKEELESRVNTYSKENPLEPQKKGEWVWGVGFFVITVGLIYMIYNQGTQKAK